MEEFYKKIIKYDKSWCKMMGIFNPYIDPFNISFSRHLPMFDRRAYYSNPKYNFVYDKLWIAKSQELKCGLINNININSNINYPIFIKPRWGHKSASSKNCFKISHYSQLRKYKHIPEMMWSEYINGTENMTDYILLNGTIIYQITYLYSDNTNGYTECYKYISPDNNPPNNIDEWVTSNLVGYSGAVNVQYRDNYIIEVGLRLARGGAYIQSTNNDNIINLINTIYNENSYENINRKELNFKPFYSFKSFTRMPILYLYPQYIIDLFMKLFNCKPFYEYYFEPNGNDGSVFFQFLHENKNIGEICNFTITYCFIFAQLFFIILPIIIIFILFNNFKTVTIKLLYIVILITIIYLTQYINPITCHYNLYKMKKQKTWW